jgi:DNA-binding Xre family transcriptional regulator/predicted DNA-binding transcriptional regulator AlpA
MIRIKIADIAKEKGLERAYALQKALDCSPTMASKLWKGTFKQIGIETIDRLCQLLDCEPSDFIVYDSGKPKAQKAIREPQTIKTIVSDSGMLTTNQVAERLGLSRKRVNDYIVLGQLPAVKGKQGHNFISESDLDKFINNLQTQKTN